MLQRRKRHINLLIVCALLCAQAAFAIENGCIYATTAGERKQVAAFSLIPKKFRESARCFHKGREILVSPNDIVLSGNVRRESFATSIGPIEARWPRAVEEHFGTSPSRAIADTAQTISKALRQPGWPASITGLNVDWKIIFMDEASLKGQVPYTLISNCHPAWKTSPGNLYFVAERVTGHCAGKRKQVSRDVADSQLARILLHEFGHGIEEYLGGFDFADDRMRSEGFATWFEQYASEYSSLFKKNELRAHYKDVSRTLHREGIRPDTFVFRGTGYDYAYASMFFRSIEKARGVYGMMNLYSTVNRGENFFEKAKGSFGWSDEKLFEMVENIIVE